MSDRLDSCFSWSPHPDDPWEWREEPALSFPRAAHILGFLPDGSVAAFGGDGAVREDNFTVEARNADDGSWYAEKRLYYDDPFRSPLP